MNRLLEYGDVSASAPARRPGVLGRLAWLAHPAYALFAVLLYLPASRNELKAALFAAAIAALTLQALAGRRHPRLAGPLLAWTVFYLALGEIFVLRGLSARGRGALFSALIYVLWPLVYAYLVSFVTTPLELRRIYQLITAGCIAVGLTVVDQFLVGAGVLPSWASVNLGEDVRAVVYEGYTHMASFTLATLVFAVPFVVASLLVLPREHLFARRAWLWAALAAGLLALLLGGRRAGLLNAALSPLVAALLWLWLPGRERRRTAWRYVAFAVGAAAALAVAAVVLDRFFGWTPTGQLTAFSSGFDFQGDEFAMERRAQFVALLRGWAEHPFFGHGFGTAATVVRNADRPWEYELQYAMLLFHTGLFGAALYASGVVWVFAQLVRMIRRGGEAGVQAIPVAVGSLMFLVANATNPYLQAYGQLWTLFLPIAALNVHRTAWRRA